jgi:hypothetical protein
MTFKWAGHVAHIVKVRNEFKILVANSEGKYYLGDLSTD